MEEQSNYNAEYSQPEPGRVGTLLYGESPEPITAMLARALIYSQDAERELEQARALKAEAERYRAQAQRDTVEKTEAFCNSLRERAARDLEQAQAAVAEATEKQEAAHAALKEAEAAREEAEAYVTKAKAEADEYAMKTKGEAEEYASKTKSEADEYGKSVRAQAEAEAKALIEKTRAELQEEIKLQHQRVDEEVRRALNGIEKMHAAVQEELAAQKLFTEALRIRAFAPKPEEMETGMPSPVMGSNGMDPEVKEPPARPRTVRQRVAP